MTNDETTLNVRMTKSLLSAGSSAFGFHLPRRSCAKTGHSFGIRHLPARRSLGEGGSFVIQ
jgi:hypothetical protein